MAEQKFIEVELEGIITEADGIYLNSYRVAEQLKVQYPEKYAVLEQEFGSRMGQSSGQHFTIASFCGGTLARLAKEEKIKKVFVSTKNMGVGSVVPGNSMCFACFACFACFGV